MRLALKLSIICLALSLSACVTKAQVEASAWLNNFDSIPKEYCGTAAHPGPLWNFAFYRKLDTGKLQIVRICNGQGHNMVSITSGDYLKILDALSPKEGIQK